MDRLLYTVLWAQLPSTGENDNLPRFIETGTNFSSIHFVAVQLPGHFQIFSVPWTLACQAPLSVGFSRQEYWSGLPFASPGILPDPGIKPRSPALWADSSSLSHQLSPKYHLAFNK